MWSEDQTENLQQFANSVIREHNLLGLNLPLLGLELGLGLFCLLACSP
jgi:hypothetical protein